MNKTVKESKKNYVAVCLILNAWFGESIHQRLKDIGSLLKDEDIKIKLTRHILGPKGLTKLKAYHSALRDFIDYWYHNEQIDQYDTAWEWCWQFFTDPKSQLIEVLEFASKEEKDWLLARIRMAEHRTGSLEEFEQWYNHKLYSENMSEFDLEAMYPDGELI